MAKVNNSEVMVAWLVFGSNNFCTYHYRILGLFNQYVILIEIILLLEFKKILFLVKLR